MGDQPAMWKAIGDFLDKIAEDTLLIILGILVVLSGAVGRVPFTDLTIAPGWQIVVGVLGVVVAAVGGLLMLRSQKRKRLQLTKCNFEITSVDHNGDVR